MKYGFLFIFLFISFFQLDAQVFDTTQRAERYLFPAINEGDCIGIAAGISLNGKCTWTDAVGYGDLEKTLSFQPSTRNRIASIAKPMTAVAVMQLVEQGKIDLDAPVQQYIPEFPDKPEGTITVRHLMSHSSGIEGYRNTKEVENQIEYPTLSDAVDWIASRDLMAVPGEEFNYSSFGYTVLGLVIERASGMTYEAYMQENIWDKAAMYNTGIEDYGVEYPNKSKLYHKGKKKIKLAEVTNLSDRIPGGGIYSTVDDLLKFGDALIDHSLISQESFNLMVDNTGLKKDGNGYGMGWYLYGDNPARGPVYGHTGGQTGVSAMFMLLPESGMTVIVISNTSGAMQRVSDIAVQLLREETGCD
ncbi:MAG: beta-lactamase family protein [Saprospiraceae bacterium]|nr:beta-lactamase family protein [Saprospiraceae bacterium]